MKSRSESWESRSTACATDRPASTTKTNNFAFVFNTLKPINHEFDMVFSSGMNAA